MLDAIRDKKKDNAGFTIIEVLIVLAIAGLILVVVLIAIPQLQRNQRNEQRRSVAARVTTEISNFAGNNNGDLPVAEANGSTGAPIIKEWGAPDSGNDDFFGRYLGCTGGADAADCTTNINDPRTGDPVGQGADGSNDLTSVILSDSVSVGTVAGSIGYRTGVVCDGEGTVAASNRNFVFQMRLEGGAIACFDNR